MIDTVLNILKGKLFKNLGIYTIVNFINSSIPFLLLPFLTNYLSTAEYAVVDIFNTISFIFIPLVGLNIVSSILRFYYDDVDFKSFLSTIISFLLIFGIIIIIVFFVFLHFSEPNLLGEGVPNNTILYALIYAFCSQIIESLLSLLRGEENPVYYGIVKISKTIVDLSFSLYFVAFLTMGWEGRVYAMLIGTSTFAVFSLIYLFKKVKINLKINKSYLKIAFSYSFPLILHSLGGYVISFSDRFIILHFLGKDQVGLYAVAYQVGMIMSFANNSFNQAWTPYLFKRLKGNNDLIDKGLHRFNYGYFIFMIILALLIYLCTPIIYRLFINENFIVDYKIVLWVLIGYALNGMYKIVVNFLFFYKKTKNLALITFSAALCNIAFCILLVPNIGILGGSISTTIAFFLMFALVYIHYLKIYKNQQIK
ncbi:lipopolysaccharide biosynthesis protein [Dokdonia sp. Asnod1-B02]|uniref:lipopolysaccharide biosynthesis protein n=1 Tax=Dokdonia sp. Asnod1-B02 TaxID=3160573 RepID=UPI0038669E2C